MGFDSSLWRRLEFEGTPIYVRPNKPDWFAPNTAGDEVLRGLSAGAAANGDIHVGRFLGRLPDDPARPYPGRAKMLSTERLGELWLHITNRCNLACSHCLFSSSPDDAEQLPGETVRRVAEQAWDLGCRVFALTGGEPLVHPDFESIVDHLLSLEGANVVVLTNGLLLQRFGDALTRWPRERLHLQVSLDGLAEAHDGVRGKGAFENLMAQLAWLKSEAIPFTISMCVQKANVGDMPEVVALAADAGAGNVHFMWSFRRGRADDSIWADPDEIFDSLRQAQARGEELGVTTDNIEALKSRAFAPIGTIHDGSSAGWDCLALGPDAKLYPSAALVGIDALAVEMGGSLAAAWRESPVFERIRQATAARLASPMKFILGGGDLDHSYIHAGEFIGHDPYDALHEKTALWLIARAASHQSDDGPPRLRLKMGDILDSCGPHGPVATVHSNCLLAVADVDGHTSVKQFYAQALHDPRREICNPVSYPEELVEHIPSASRVRNYGCGSPVLDAGLECCDRVVDLGCGTGVECLVAAKLVGPTGKVIGVDMLDEMLAFARKSADAAAKRLGYHNVEFRKGYLEELPLEDDSVNVVLSNCVLNLSSNKRRTFAEIRRVLREGGRLMISDVVCETEPDPTIRNDEVLRGQCIAGAMTQRDLFGLLEESHFVSARVVKWLPYRQVGGHQFFSVTFEAYKSAGDGMATVMYRGPGAALVTPSGAVLPAGRACRIPASELTGAGADVFELDEDGCVEGMSLESTCGCACAPPAEAGLVQLQVNTPEDQSSGHDDLEHGQRGQSCC